MGAPTTQVPAQSALDAFGLIVSIVQWRDEHMPDANVIQLHPDIVKEMERIAASAGEVG